MPARPPIPTRSGEKTRAPTPTDPGDPTDRPARRRWIRLRLAHLWAAGFVAGAAWLGLSPLLHADPVAVPTTGSVTGRVVDRRGRPVMSTLVIVRAPVGGAPTPSEPDEVSLTIGRFGFERAVVGGRPGATIAVDNVTDTPHLISMTVHWLDRRPYSKRHEWREQPLSRHGLIEERVEGDAPAEVRVHCARHPWEKTAVILSEVPYRATTDADGRFTVEGVPPGEHRVVVWMPEWGTRRAEARVIAGETTEADFSAPKAKAKK